MSKNIEEGDLVKHRQKGRTTICTCLFMVNVPYGTLGIVRNVGPSGSIAIIEWLDIDKPPTGYRPYPECEHIEIVGKS